MTFPLITDDVPDVSFELVIAVTLVVTSVLTKVILAAKGVELCNERWTALRFEEERLALVFADEVVHVNGTVSCTLVSEPPVVTAVVDTKDSVPCAVVSEAPEPENKDELV